MTLGKLGFFLGLLLVVGLIIVPRLLGYVARFKSNEMLLITVLGLVFRRVAAGGEDWATAWRWARFIIGAVIAEAREIHRIETLIEPVRDMFSAIFFVAIGLLIEPRLLVSYGCRSWSSRWRWSWARWSPVPRNLPGRKRHGAPSLRVGMGLAQIGEFSFIIAALGLIVRRDQQISLSDRGGLSLRSPL